MNSAASLIGFRLITRALSAVINIHNEEYKPKNCGFCVANHTSPIDVAILSTHCIFSLVRYHMITLKMMLHARNEIIIYNNVKVKKGKYIYECIGKQLNKGKKENHYYVIIFMFL
jgi:hypothetical protein